jgi:hypothetical protein
MQLDFTPKQTDAEKLALLRPYRQKYVMLVVVCRGYMVKQYGTLFDFDEAGTMLALNCLHERFRFVYNDHDFEQLECKAGNTKDRWQYVPLALLEKAIVL